MSERMIERELRKQRGLLALSEAAERLGISLTSIDRRINAGTLTSIHYGSRHLVSELAIKRIPHDWRKEAMSEQKGKKPSPSALLFWGGLSLGPIGAVLALIIPSAPWTAILVALLGAVVAGRQHILDDRAHRLEVKRLEARDTQSSELRIIGNVSKAPETMPPNRERESEASQ